MKQATSLFVASLFLIEPLLSMWHTTTLFPSLLPYVYGAAGMLLWVYPIIRNRKFPLRYSLLDILILASLLYNVVGIWRYDQMPQWCVLITIYLLARQGIKEQTIAYILTGAGLLQCFLMSLQYMGYIPSGHGTFPATGSFTNPGPLGGLLSVCFMACVSMRNNISKKWWIIMITILAAGVALTDSRAAWLAVILALGYKVVLHYRLKIYIIIPSFILMTAFVWIGSFHLYKPLSAQGRIEIWKASLPMIADSPIIGKGTGSFQREYMHYQAQYIQQHHTPQSLLLGDNNYAFNEFLRITCEQGIIGIMLILAIIAYLFIHPPIRRSPIFPCFIAYLVFASFSYPTDIFLLCVTMALLLGHFSAKISPMTISVPPVFAYTVCVGTFICVGWLISRGGRCFYIERALDDYLYKENKESARFLRESYPDLKNSTDFVFHYAYILYLKGEYEEAIPVLQQAIHLYPTTDKYCDLGNAYQELEQFDKAEEAYKEAKGLLPHRFYPRYCLFMLYKENGFMPKAKQEAEGIMQLLHKTNDSQEQEIKMSARLFLEGRN